MNPAPALPVPASFGRRLAALLIDYALIVGWMVVLGGLTLLIWAITGQIFNWLDLGTWGAQLLGFVVLVLPVGIYLYACEASAKQATVGKRAVGLRVVTAASGARPSRGRILIRTIVKLLPWELAHTALWQLMSRLLTGEEHIPGWLILALVVVDVLPLVYVLMVAF